jgi:DNA-damage-inducible protein D
MASEVTLSPAYRHTMHRLEAALHSNSQGDDYWVAREIAPILGYPAWDKFLPVIERAAASITANGGEPSHHIAQASKMMGVGKGAKRHVTEYFLSRGACYLVAMNGDPTKPQIAAAQAYFATQARSAELSQNESADRHRLAVRERVTTAFKRVSDVAKDVGVTHFPFFHNARWQGLYGNSRKAVETAKGLRDGETLFDRAGALELSAHEFQMQLAATKILEEGITGEQDAINANLDVAKQVRETIIDQSGVRLEHVKLEQEPIASVKRRLSPSAKAKRIGKA